MYTRKRNAVIFGLTEECYTKQATRANRYLPCYLNALRVRIRDFTGAR